MFAGGPKIIVMPLKKRNDQKDDTGVKMGSEERTHPHQRSRGAVSSPTGSVALPRSSTAITEFFR